MLVRRKTQEGPSDLTRTIIRDVFLLWTAMLLGTAALAQDAPAGPTVRREKAPQHLEQVLGRNFPELHVLRASNSGVRISPDAPRIFGDLQRAPNG
jgi:hypothetical protein